METRFDGSIWGKQPVATLTDAITFSHPMNLFIDMISTELLFIEQRKEHYWNISCYQYSHAH